MLGTGFVHVTLGSPGAAVHLSAVVGVSNSRRGLTCTSRICRVLAFWALLACDEAGAAIAVRNTTHAGTLASTLTLAVPAGTLPNDVMVASIAFRPASGQNSSNVTVTSPASWNLLDYYDSSADYAALALAIGTNPGGTLLGTRSTFAVAGLATFPDLSIDRAGTGYTLTAASTDMTGATSDAFDVAADAGASDAAVQDSGPSDGGLADAGPLDAGASNEAMSDAGRPDGGATGAAPGPLENSERYLALPCGCSQGGLGVLVWLAAVLLSRRNPKHRPVRKTNAGCC